MSLLAKIIVKEWIKSLLGAIIVLFLLVSIGDIINGFLRNYDVERILIEYILKLPVNNIFERFSIYPLKDFTPTKSGYLVYLFSDLHFERSCGGPSFLNWANTTRVYSLEDDKLIKGGYYKDTASHKFHMIKKGFRKFLNHFVKVKIKEEPSFEFAQLPDCRKIVARLLFEVKRKYLEAFPNGKVILVNLNFVDDKIYSNILKDIVDSYSTTSPLTRDYDHHIIFQKDSHVTSTFNKLFVDHLVKIVDEFD